jgi:hypothetical protein
MIVPLIIRIVAENPAITNKTLRGLLNSYGREYALTEAVLNEARISARLELFGTPDLNVTYADNIQEELRKRGHIVRMKYTNRRETLKNIERLVISEEMLRRKHADNSTMSANDRKAFIDKWKSDNGELLREQLGPKDVGVVQFLHGIFLTPCFSQATVPKLQRLIMSDACHLNFGKYTLFSCYGVTANANMFPIGFAIIFGNENAVSWKEFWSFVADIHPCLNQMDVTIVTDQDKGQQSAIRDVMKLAGQFHCSFHRRQNIIKMCGNKLGNRVYSAMWTYNRLVECRTIEQLEAEKQNSFPMMHHKDLTYLNNLDDVSQYPAARCAMGQGIYMYHRSSSASVESMNAANRDMRAKRAVDPLNACLLLLRMECRRFMKQRKLAWETEGELTKHGLLEYDEVFRGIDCLDFNISIVEKELCFECSVRRNVGKNKSVGNVVISKEPIRESYFGTCTCGVDTRDAVPCQHMAAVVVSCRIPQLTRINIMPYWWRVDHWRLQFPLEVVAECNVSMETIRDEVPTPNGNYRYCPSWSAPNKAG